MNRVWRRQYTGPRKKYGNEITSIDGIKFDSKKEGRRYLILKDLLTKGDIKDLRLQVPYELVPALYEDEIVHLKTKDKIVKRCVQRAITYVADFVYLDKDNNEIIEDVKGGKASITKEFLLKKKLLRYFHGKDIVIV